MARSNDATPKQGMSVCTQRKGVGGVEQINKGKLWVLRQGLDTFPDKCFRTVFRGLQRTLECHGGKATLIGLAMAMERIHERFSPTVEVSGHKLACSL
ncbi:hypothetical protein ALQ21_00882 [Pseudomonas savastanoi pv. glycinea]|nr:hypothetical protein ALQ21_00882 [Pseudomonas savastanoi pv. glycinea]